MHAFNESIWITRVTHNFFSVFYDARIVSKKTEIFEGALVEIEYSCQIRQTLNLLRLILAAMGNYTTWMIIKWCKLMIGVYLINYKPWEVLISVKYVFFYQGGF